MTAAPAPQSVSRRVRRGPAWQLRPARPEDLDALVELEQRCFVYDRLSRRSFRHFLATDTATCLVAEHGGGLLGYVLVLFHGRTALARLYSMAVAPEQQGQGLGRELLRAAEAAALDGGAALMRLEVNPGNAAAVALYRSVGYTDIGIYRAYYEDDSDALRMEHALVPRVQPIAWRVPHYRQTLDFTCGAACLMMAMKALDKRLKLDRRLELRLWREATTIFMTSGHGGCGPHGLALAAWRRGFAVDLFVNDERPPFLDTVRDREKKARDPSGPRGLPRRHPPDRIKCIAASSRSTPLAPAARRRRHSAGPDQPVPHLWRQGAPLDHRLRLRSALYLRA